MVRVLKLPAEAGRIQLDAVWRSEQEPGILLQVLTLVLPGLMPAPGDPAAV